MDDDALTLADIGAMTTATPPPHVFERLVDEFYATWMTDESGLTVSNVTERTMARLGLETFEWDAFDYRLKEEELKHMKLTTFLHLHRMVGSQAHLQLMQIADVFHNARDVFQHSARLVCNLRPRASIAEVGSLLPEEWRDPERLEEENVNIHTYDFNKKKNPPALNVFVHLQRILMTCNYRRAHGKFFRRVVLPGDIETLAFEEAINIPDFVALHCSHERDVRAWRWTMKKGVFEQVVSYLTHRPLREAPDLDECHHLRSYGGDEYGRGAGVYDARSDMIFWYHMRDEWEHMAQEVQKRRRALYRVGGGPKRRKHEQEYVCTAPRPGDVCVVHLRVPFPHDIYAEVVYAAAPPRHLRWREAFAFEVADYATEVPAGVAARLASRAPCRSPAAGCAWQWVYTAPPGSRCLDADYPALAADLRKGNYYYQSKDLTQLLAGRSIEEASGALEHGYVTLDEGGFAVPLPTPRLRRFELTEEEWCAAGGGDAGPLAWCAHQDDASRGLAWECVGSEPPEGGVELRHEGLAAHLARRGRELSPAEWEALGAPAVAANAYVRDAEGRCYRGVGRRYFVRDLGASWADVATPELDHIFDCQGFSAHDRFFLYALLGRLFFEVGELDDAQLTLFFEGIGGSGKLTLLQAMYSFWAPHRRAILSPNMQPQFSMGSLAHGDVAFCTEVSADLNLPQAEWQAATGGASLQLAVKRNEPIERKWRSQFLWAGTAFPRHWNNVHGQVSRRLAGVLFHKPVNPRSLTLLEDIRAKGGLLQRRCVLAYHLFVRLLAGRDPMSDPARLPPAFREFYDHGRRESDPMEAFLSLDTYVVAGDKMLLEHFRALFARFHQGTPPRWGAELYGPAFRARGLSVVRMERVTLGDESYSNVDVVVGVRPAA
jgi:hypothetical protein